MGFGGKAANAAVMCARMGGQVSLIAKLGQDANGLEYRSALAKESIDTSFVFTDYEQPTGVAQIMVETSSGQNMIIVVPGSNLTLSPQEVLEAEKMISSARLLCFGLEGNHQSIIKAMELAKKANITTLTNAAPASADLDPRYASFISNYMTTIRFIFASRIYATTDILCVNESEAQIILGQETVIETEEAIQAAMNELLKKCPTVVITLGSKGAAIATRKQPKAQWVLAEKVQTVVDTTGAGDSFVGAMAFYLANHPGLDLGQVVDRACRVATITVQKEGTQTSFPHRSELPNSLFE